MSLQAPFPLSMNRSADLRPGTLGPRFNAPGRRPALLRVCAPASWSAPVLWRFRSGPSASAKAPEDWRTLKPGGPSEVPWQPEGG